MLTLGILLFIKDREVSSFLRVGEYKNKFLVECEEQQYRDCTRRNVFADLQGMGRM